MVDLVLSSYYFLLYVPYVFCSCALPFPTISWVNQFFFLSIPVYLLHWPLSHISSHYFLVVLLGLQYTYFIKHNVPWINIMLLHTQEVWSKTVQQWNSISSPTLCTIVVIYFPSTQYIGIIFILENCHLSNF